MHMLRRFQFHSLAFILLLTVLYAETTEKPERRRQGLKTSPTPSNREQLNQHENATNSNTNNTMGDSVDTTTQQPELRRKKQEGPMEIMVSAITPTSIHLLVNVSRPSAVWCKTSAEGDILSNELIMKSSRGDYVTNTKEIVLMQLSPNTVYDIHCLNVYTADDKTDNHLMVIHSVITGDAYFSISKIRRTRKRISYQIHTNMNGNIVCYLMNRKPVILSTIEIDLSKKKNVLFNAPDKRTPLMTKCEMYNNYNTVMISTAVEDIAPYQTAFKALLPYLTIGLLVWIIRFIWRNRKRFDPTTTIVDKEDTEKISLLKKINADNLVTGHTKDVDLLDEKVQSIKCYRCGFVNATNSTVCKECNTLLKGDIITTEKKQQRYY